ncbi:MAG: hypothetical protein R3A45_01940 [Bdellovibrionota bacterium]|nr:hypothetical protein [Deltaproteobacteria bacterium]
MQSLRERVWGYSKIEWISFAMVGLCFLTFLFPGCNRWRKQSKAKEALTNVKIIFDAQQKYFAAQLKENPQFATYLSLPMTPSSPTSDSQLAAFDQEPWSKLELNIDRDVLYSYEVLAHEIGPKAYFEVYARGDIDGDGHFSIYKVRGAIDPNGKPIGSDIIYKMDPLE